MITKSLICLILSSFLASCSLSPAWILQPNPRDWDAKRKRFPDTERNRKASLSVYSNYIKREVEGEKHDWDARWKRIFDALDSSNDNPDFYKNYIIQTRRQANLPELSFIKKR